MAMNLATKWHCSAAQAPKCAVLLLLTNSLFSAVYHALNGLWELLSSLKRLQSTDIDSTVHYAAEG